MTSGEAASVAIMPSLPAVSSSSEWNKDGFALVHRAVVQKNNLRIEKLLSISPFSLDAKTTDKFKLTPLLVAAKYGCTDTFHFLLKMGANINTKSAKGRTAVQCALVQNQYRLVSSLLAHPQFTVIKEIFGTLASRESLMLSELANTLEVFNAILVSHIVAEDRDKVAATVYEDEIKIEEGMGKLIHLIKSCLSSKEMLNLIGPIVARILQNLCYSDSLCEEIIASSVPEQQIKLMGAMSSPEGITALIQVGAALVAKGSVRRMMSLHAPRVCLDAVMRTGSENVMLTAVTCMLHCADNPEAAKTFNSDGVLADLVSKLDSPEISAQIKSLIIQILTKVAGISEYFRKAVLKLKAVDVLLTQLNRKSKLIIVITDLLRVMCVQKGDTESIIKQSKPAISTLIYVIKNSISTHNQHKAFAILWLMAGEDLQERRALANLVGPVGLTKMLDVTSEKHLFTATTALNLISPPHHGKQVEIVENGAVSLLLSVIQIQTTSPETQLQALSTLENCTHDIGLRPIEEMRYAFMHEKGVQILLKLQASTENVSVQLQALCTLAAVSIRCLKIKQLIIRDPLFSVRKLIRLLNYAELERQHQLLVMRSLCYLAYSSLEVQTIILNTKPLPVQPFRDLMTSADSKTGSESAFHAIVLAKVFDKTGVEIVADCIRYLVRTLKRALEEGDDELQMHICTFVSGLLHMRAGICHAFVAVDLVSLLVRVILTPFEHCRKTAAITLSYITKDTNGGRVVLGCCRKNEKLYTKIVQYSYGYSLGKDFVERWHRFKVAYHSHRDQKKMLARRRTSNVISLAFKGAKFFSK